MPPKPLQRSRRKSRRQLRQRDHDAYGDNEIQEGPCITPLEGYNTNQGARFRGWCNCGYTGTRELHLITSYAAKARHQRKIDGMALTAWAELPNAPPGSIIGGQSDNTCLGETEMPSDLSSDDSGTNRLPSSDDSDTSCLVENRYGRSRSRSLGLDGSGEDKAESSDCRGWEVDSGEEEEREESAAKHPWIPSCPTISKGGEDDPDKLCAAIDIDMDPLGLIELVGRSWQQESTALSYSTGHKFGRIANGFVSDEERIIGAELSDSEDSDIDWEELLAVSRMELKKKRTPRPLYKPSVDISEDEYEYQKLQEPLTKRDALSYAIIDIQSSHQVPREASYKFTRLLRAGAPAPPYDSRTTLRHLQKRTGIRFVEYDCCINSCMSYGPFPERTTCTHCGEDRYNENGRSRASYLYIPIIHRLKLQYASPKRAQKLTEYRASVESRGGDSTNTDDLHEDFWNGQLYCDQKEQGLYSQDTDLGFFFSTDGVRIFKTRSNFQIYPLLLVNLSLPPVERVKHRSMLLSGIIPGPKGPKDLDSFLYPLIREFKDLEVGVKAWNGFRRQEFILRAYISLIGADMVAREKLMHMQGSGAYKYCYYCTASGIYNGYVYCPFHPPKDAPNRPSIEKSKPNWRTYDPMDLPKRKNELFRRQASHITFNIEKDDYVSATGITGISIFSCLKSIDFPRSFGVDFMHLFYENVAGLLFDHWRGRFFSSKQGTVAEDSSESSEGLSDTEDGGESDVSIDEVLELSKKPNRKRKRAATEAINRGRLPKANKAKKKAKCPRDSNGKPARTIQKFEQTSDPYCIAPNIWAQIGQDMEQSSATFPALFGDRIRSIYYHCHEWKAAEWSNWVRIFAPVYLKGNLPEEDYEEFMSLVSVINTCCDYTNTLLERQDVRVRMARFLEYYERRYYREEWARLPAMRPVFHYLAHAADSLSECGPGWVYWQFPMERLCGIISSRVKSRVQANKNLSNIVLLEEQKNGFLWTLDNHNPVEGFKSQLADIVGEDGEHGAINKEGSSNIFEVYCQLMDEHCQRDSSQEGSQKSSQDTYHGIDDSPIAIFRGKRVLHTFQDAEIRLIHDFFAAAPIIPLEAIPSSAYRRYSLEYRELMECPERFTVRSSMMKKSTEGRTASWVRFESTRSSGELRSHLRVDKEDQIDDNSTRSSFAKVLFFFSLALEPEYLSDDLKARLPAEFRFAFVETCTVYCDELLLYRNPKEALRLELVPVEDIKELVGLLVKGEREYVVGKSGPCMRKRLT